MNICENCELEHNGKYGSGRFCTIKCSKSFSTKNKRIEINLKVSKTLTGSGNSYIIKNCKNCDKIFNIKFSKRNQKFCSKSCSAKFISNTKDGIEQRQKIGLISSLSQNRRSKNEICFYKLCNDFFKSVECNKSIFNGWDADIIIHDINHAILWNGKWHYEKITKKHSLKQVQNRDKIKIKEIKKLGYIPYIIKDMGRYDEKFVEIQFNIFLKYLNNDNKNKY